MAFEIIGEKKPSYSGVAMAAIIFTSIVLFVTGVAFAYLLISGKGSNYLLGTLLAFEFLSAGIAVILYGRAFVAFREVSEDREEELLW
jgi:Sec-independent protein secretion pathway component TatC